MKYVYVNVIEEWWYPSNQIDSIANKCLEWW